MTTTECKAETKNGFDLSAATIPVADIHRGGPPRDGIPALTDAPVIPADRADFLEEKDLVVGVEFGGRTRAYPLRILVWHEIANDTVGGQPIAVTYCPLCNSTLVFDRRAGNRLREFGVSGLLWNSNVLMYDRARPGTESLWSQAKMQAVTGPAAGAKLKLLPSMLTTWADWRKRHPDTDVLSPATGHGRDYATAAGPYATYFANDRLMFPVARSGTQSDAKGDARHSSAATGSYRNKDMFLVVGSGPAAKAYAYRDLAAHKESLIKDTILQREIVIHYDATNKTAVVQNGTEWPVAYMFWFTLRSFRPDIPVWQPK